MALRLTSIALLIAVACGDSATDDWKQSLTAEQRASLEKGLAWLQKKSQKEQAIASQDGPKAQAFFVREYDGKAQDLLQLYQKKAAAAANAASDKNAKSDAPKAVASPLMLAAVPDADVAGTSSWKQDQEARDAAREADEAARRAARKADEAARKAARKTDEAARRADKEKRREAVNADSKADAASDKSAKSDAPEAVASPLMLAAVPDADVAGTSSWKQDQEARDAAREADEAARRAARKADEAARKAARKADEAAIEAARRADKQKRREAANADSKPDSSSGSSADAESQQNGATMLESMLYDSDASVLATFLVSFVAGVSLLAIVSRRNRGQVALLDDAAEVYYLKVAPGQ